MVGEKPYVANGSTKDPREKIMWDFYIESIIIGQVNAYESAIKAGYSHDHARNITLQGWFKERLENLERQEMLSKAEKKLSKTLTYEVEDKETGKVQIDLLRIQTDVAKFVAERLNKEKYSSRTEQTGKDGKDLIPETLTEDEKNKLKQLFGKGNI